MVGERVVADAAAAHRLDIADLLRQLLWAHGQATDYAQPALPQPAIVFVSLNAAPTRMQCYPDMAGVQSHSVGDGRSEFTVRDAVHASQEDRRVDAQQARQRRVEGGPYLGCHGLDCRGTGLCVCDLTVSHRLRTAGAGRRRGLIRLRAHMYY